MRELLANVLGQGNESRLEFKINEFFLKDGLRGIQKAKSGWTDCKIFNTSFTRDKNTNQFPTSIYLTTYPMLPVLKCGGFLRRAGNVGFKELEAAC